MKKKFIHVSDNNQTKVVSKAKIGRQLRKALVMLMALTLCMTAACGSKKPANEAGNEQNSEGAGNEDIVRNTGSEDISTEDSKKLRDMMTDEERENRIYTVTESETAADEDNVCSEEFMDIYMNFSVELLKNSREKDNAMVSPLSVISALEMARLGADGETRKEINKVLYGMETDGREAELYSFRDSLQSNLITKVEQANSIWIRKDSNDFAVDEDFLNQNKKKNKADVFFEPFNTQTVDEINDWVSKNTDGMIDKIVEEIDVESQMYLINAISFDAEWNDKYLESNVIDGKFQNTNGAKSDVEMMKSLETSYIESENARGFIKPYSGRYSYVAILPDRDITLDEYVENLSGEELSTMINEVYKGIDVYAQLPKYTAENSYELSATLKQMGMPSAFENTADFSKMGEALDGLRISRVIHKTKIQVTEDGTKAAAVTEIDMKCGAAMGTEEEERIDMNVVLDRPFMYAIIDNNTKLPIFIGTVDSFE